jgi:hypothetical protein
VLTRRYENAIKITSFKTYRIVFLCKISISGAVFQSQNANNNNLHPWSTVAHQSEEMTLKSTEKKMKEQNVKTSSAEDLGWAGLGHVA